MTPFEAAAIVQARVGDPELMGIVWPSPSGLSPVAYEILTRIGKGFVTYTYRGGWEGTGCMYPLPWIKAFKGAVLITSHILPTEVPVVVAELTDLGRVMTAPGFRIHQPDLLDVLAGAE